MSGIVAGNFWFALCYWCA